MAEPTFDVASLTRLPTGLAGLDQSAMTGSARGRRSDAKPRPGSKQ